MTDIRTATVWAEVLVDTATPIQVEAVWAEALVEATSSRAQVEAVWAEVLVTPIKPVSNAPITIATSSATTTLVMITTGTAPVAVGTTASTSGSALTTGTAPIALATSSATVGPMVTTGSSPIVLATSAATSLFAVLVTTGMAPVAVGTSASTLYLVTTGMAAIGVATSSATIGPPPPPGPTYTTRIPSSVEVTGGLGCGFNEAVIFDRGGMTRLFPIDKTTFIDYARVKDDISNALIRVPTTAECCQRLADVEPIRNELVIFRDGQRVWEGPITRMGFSRDEVEIAAKDVLFWPYRTIMRADYDNAYPNITTVTNRVNTIFRAEMARKEALSPPINLLPYLQIHVMDGEARTSRHTLPFQKTVWEELDDLAAKSGIDYVAVGRAIHVQDTEYILGQTALATDADFLGGVIVTAYGMNLSTFSSVTDGQGNHGDRYVVDNYYGEIETLATAFDEQATAAPTEEEMASQAQRNLSQRYPVPVAVRIPDNSQINPKSQVFSFDNLIPGVKVPVMATLGCRQVKQYQKIETVRITQDSRGEVITMTLFPFPGQVPSDIGGLF